MSGLGLWSRLNTGPVCDAQAWKLLGWYTRYLPKVVTDPSANEA